MELSGLLTVLCPKGSEHGRGRRRRWHLGEVRKLWHGLHCGEKIARVRVWSETGHEVDCRWRFFVNSLYETEGKGGGVCVVGHVRVSVLTPQRTHHILRHYSFPNEATTELSAILHVCG